MSFPQLHHLLEILATLRGPDGCPWDRKQTPQSAARWFSDEIHEYLEKIDEEDVAGAREELSDLIGRYVGELAALHTSVRGGDSRSDEQNIAVANLGARFSRDEQGGGFKIEYIYKADPDYPDEKSPLDDPYLDIQAGDIITHVNGKAALSALDIGESAEKPNAKEC